MNQGLILILAAAVCACVPTPSSANVKLARVFGECMVLQRDKPLPVWGAADPGEEITVTLGTDKASVTADAAGKWLVRLPARPATAEPIEMTVTGKNRIALKNILVGDVWLASGQSNMQFAFFWAKTGQEELQNADYPLIRFFNVATCSSDTPRDLDRGGWNICTPKGAMNYSKLAYYFARDIHRKTNVPIGIISSAFSGTAIDAWMDAPSLAADPAGAALLERWQKVLEEYPAKKERYVEAKAAWEAEKAAAVAAGQKFAKPAPNPPASPGSQSAPSSLYNAMIHPFVPLALRGVIWYQGENNTKAPEQYRTLFPSLIKGWRTAFGQSDLPFYWVQLTIYNTADGNWPGLREAQTAALALPHTGQAVTIDIGEGSNIHPNNKEEVGRRLALIALARTYGDKSVVDSGPVFERAEFSGGAARIHLRSLAGGLQKKDPAAPIAGFEIAGADKIFRPAAAEIDGATLLIKSPSVSEPAAVRYAWRNNIGGLNLLNSAGLPLAPFRTDTW